MNNFEIAGKTDVGMARQVNEDNLVSFESRNGTVVAVCDGMGGQAAGDVASKLACDSIRDILTNNDFANPVDAIKAAVTGANLAILHRTQLKPEYTGMGATCVILLIRDGKVYYGWVGDSRIYYINGKTITQLSKDQSYVQTLVDAGQITAAEAETHPQKNEITNALGMANMTPPQIGAVPLTPDPGSIVLLCSDGLSGMIDPMRIEQICSDPRMTLQQKAGSLIDAANAAGGYDNITVQLVQFGGAAAPAAPAVARPEPTGNTASRKASGVVEKEQRKRTVIYACVGVVIVVALIFFIMNLLGSGKEKPAPNPSPKTEDVRKIHHDPTPEPAPTPTPNVSVQQQKEPTPKANNGKQKGSSDNPATVIKKSKDKEKTKEVVKTVNEQKKEKEPPKTGKGRTEGDDM